MVKWETDAQLAVIQVMHDTVLPQQCVPGALVGQSRRQRRPAVSVGSGTERTGGRVWKWKQQEDMEAERQSLSPWGSSMRSWSRAWSEVDAMSHSV